MGLNIEQTGSPPQASVAVVPLFYGREEVVAACIDSLLAAKARRPFSLFAIENPSDHSPANRALIDRLAGTGQIEGAYFPERNAVFNSLL